MLDDALYGLLHVLVFVYWLGGDLGAFYASRFLTRPGVPADRRLLAAKIVNDVDMAPRSALIMALPTGLLLAISKGWIAAPDWWGWAAMAAGLVWLFLAWTLHQKHVAAGPLKLIDTGIRWLLAFALAGAGGAALAGVLELPAFIALKFILLAAAIFLGLFIRTVLKPLGPALGGLASDNSAAAEASLAATLNRARPLVVMIWVVITAAALLGLWTPTGFGTQ